MKFKDREDAGWRLATRLLDFRFENPVILALARGGISVAYEVARMFQSPFEVLLVRKLGVPMMPEVSFGAVAEGGIVYLDQGLVKKMGISKQTIQEIALAELTELERRRELYRDGRPLPSLAGRAVILIDDGVANGWTVRAAIGRIRKEKPGKIVLGVPVAQAHVAEELRSEVDTFVCLEAPLDFMAVSQYYADYRQVQEKEALALLERARQEARVPA
jgi:putative phosphoribosyl transferase